MHYNFLFYKDNSLVGVTFLGGFIRDNLKILLPKLLNLVLIKNFSCFILTSAKFIKFRASQIYCGEAGAPEDIFRLLMDYLIYPGHKIVYQADD